MVFRTPLRYLNNLEQLDSIVEKACELETPGRVTPGGTLKQTTKVLTYIGFGLAIGMAVYALINSDGSDGLDEF